MVRLNRRSSHCIQAKNCHRPSPPSCGKSRSCVSQAALHRRSRPRPPRPTSARPRGHHPSSLRHNHARVGEILEAKRELPGHASKTSIPVYRKAGHSILECSFTVNFSRFNSLLRTNSILDYNLTFFQSINRTQSPQVFWIPPGPRTHGNCDSPYYSSPVVFGVPVPTFFKIRRQLQSWKRPLRSSD